MDVCLKQLSGTYHRVLVGEELEQVRESSDAIVLVVANPFSASEEKNYLDAVYWATGFQSAILRI